MKQVIGQFALAIIVCAAACRPRPAPSPPVAAAAPGAVRWLKGQTHAHSGNSRDSRTPPAEVVRWYESRGFDFVVFTDHNYVTQAASTERLLVIPGVELTQNLPDCEPPPPDGLQCLLHMNVLFARPIEPIPWPDLDDRSRLAIYSAELEVARRLGGIAQLNHPNFHYGADGELIGQLVKRGLRLFEVANQSVDANNRGDALHESTERVWDRVLARSEAPLYGVATDDAHHYWDAAGLADAGAPVYTGDRGFLMVRAQKEAASIRAAIERGDFYSSNGVMLSRVEVTDGALVLEAEPGKHRALTFEFIGAGGARLAMKSGHAERFELRGAPAGWLRAVVRDDQGHTAWVQPVPVGANAKKD